MDPIKHPDGTVSYLPAVTSLLEKHGLDKDKDGFINYTLALDVLQLCNTAHQNGIDHLSQSLEKGGC